MVYRPLVAAVVCLGLVPSLRVAAEGVVKFERIEGKAASPAFKFNAIPALSDEDAGQDAVVEVVDGTQGYGADPRILIDGAGPTFSWDDRRGFSFSGKTGGRVRMDLGSVQPIGQVNSYSWHQGDRAPQVYVLYGSDGTSEKFVAAPRRGVNPGEAGWVKIAAVDTRPPGYPQKENGAGQYGVSITDAKGELGKFRYLLWDCLPSIEGGSAACLYAEFDVVTAGQGGTSRAATVRTTGGKRLDGRARLDGDRLVLTTADGKEQRFTADELAEAHFLPGSRAVGLPAPNGSAVINGLRGEYFAGQDLTNLKMVRYDPTIYFTWRNGPDASVGDEYSVRWTGQLATLATGSHQFHSAFDGGVRLWIDGKKIIDAWDDKYVWQREGSIQLEGGRKYDFKLECRAAVDPKHRADHGKAKVSWSYPGLGRQPLTPDRLQPPAADIADVSRIRLKSPVDGTWLRAPAEVELEASLGEGAPRPARVDFYAGGDLVGTAAEPPYRSTWKNPPAGYYAITARAVDASGVGISSQVCRVALPGAGDGSIPAPWGALRLGPPGEDVAAFAGGAFTLEAHGGLLHGTLEACTFVTQPLDGDGQITCRVADFPKDQFGWAGLMLRESLVADSPGVALIAGKDGARLLSRNERGAGMSVNSVNRQVPCWLRLTRRGSSIRVFASDDGARWVPVYTPLSMNLPRRVYVGVVAVGPADDGNLSATIDHVALVSPLPTAEFTGPGLLTRGGGLLAGEVRKASADEVTVVRARGGDVTVPAANVARIYFKPVPTELTDEIQHGRTGVLLASGDFFEGQFRGVKENRVSVDSVVFGLKSFSLYENTLLAAVLADPSPEPHDEVTAADGSALVAKSIRIENGRLVVEDETAGEVSLSVRGVSEIKRKP